MTNKKNKRRQPRRHSLKRRKRTNYQNDYAKSLFAIIFMSTLLLFLGLTYSSKAPSIKTQTLFPLFGNFYPQESTNFVSIPNLRKGSGIR